jgi:hypothetical protein
MTRSLRQCTVTLAVLLRLTLHAGKGFAWATLPLLLVPASMLLQHPSEWTSAAGESVLIVLLGSGWAGLCAAAQQLNRPTLAAWLPGQHLALRLTVVAMSVVVWALAMALGGWGLLTPLAWTTALLIAAMPWAVRWRLGPLTLMLALPAGLLFAAWYVRVHSLGESPIDLINELSSPQASPSAVLAPALMALVVALWLRSPSTPTPQGGSTPWSGLALEWRHGTPLARAVALTQPTLRASRLLAAATLMGALGACLLSANLRGQDEVMLLTLLGLVAMALPLQLLVSARRSASETSAWALLRILPGMPHQADLGSQVRWAQAQRFSLGCALMLGVLSALSGATLTLVLPFASAGMLSVWSIGLLLLLALRPLQQGPLWEAILPALAPTLLLIAALAPIDLDRVGWLSDLKTFAGDFAICAAVLGLAVLIQLRRLASPLQSGNSVK